TAVRGDHHDHGTVGQLQNIVIPYHTVHLFLDDTVHDARPVHGVDHLIPDLKHLIPHFLCHTSAILALSVLYYSNFIPFLQVKSKKNKIPGAPGSTSGRPAGSKGKYWAFRPGELLLGLGLLLGGGLLGLLRGLL